MRDWLRSWIMFFYKKDGYYGIRLPGFVGTWWTIWLLRNEQVFRQVRPTAASILRSLQQSDGQHASFSQVGWEQASVMRDPVTPPGFLQIQLGNLASGGSQLKMQIHAVWDMSTLSTGIGWAICVSPDQPIRKYGCYSFASSTIAAMSMACLKAVTWALLAGYLNIILTTTSTSLLRTLRTTGSQDISIKWTIAAIRNTAFTLNSCQLVRGCRSQITEAQQVALWCRQHKMDFGWGYGSFFLVLFRFFHFEFIFWFGLFLGFSYVVRFAVVKKKKMKAIFIIHFKSQMILL